MALPNSVLRSSTAPNGAYSGAELLNYSADNRKLSSETRNSSSPDDGNDSNTNNSHNRRRQENRPSSRNKRRNVNSLIPLEKSADSELPSVLDENITGTRLNPPSQHHKASRVTGRPAVLKPINSNDQLIAPSQPPKHKNPLSISGLAKPEYNAEDVGGAGWTQTQNIKVPTVTRPPIITSQHQANNNNSNSATSSSTSSSVQKVESNGALSTLTVTASSSNTYSIPRRPSKQLTNSQYSPSNNTKQAASKKQGASAIDADAKYADPIAGASPSFQARLSELASLEAETVRYERLKRLKKKSKDKED